MKNNVNWYTTFPNNGKIYNMDLLTKSYGKIYGKIIWIQKCKEREQKLKRILNE